MAINVNESVQYKTVEFSSIFYYFDPMRPSTGNPTESHVLFVLITDERFDTIPHPSRCGCSEGLDAFRFLIKIRLLYAVPEPCGLH